MSSGPSHARSTRWLLVGAMLAGLLVRAPGAYWGWNFPPQWGLHHPDEFTHLFYAQSLIRPSVPQDVDVQPYPPSLGAMAAAPLVLWRAVRGELSSERPPAGVVITAGRVFSIACGTATILVVFLLGRQLSGDPRVALMAASVMALGGLHVSLSHHFVSDVPATFFVLTAQLLLLRDLQRPEASPGRELDWAALAAGIAFGLKLNVAILPSLGLAALLRAPRLLRVTYCALLLVAGFTGTTVMMYTPLDLLATLREGVGDPYVFSRLMGLVVYAIELPAILSFPVLLLSLAGGAMLARGLWRTRGERRAMAVLVALALPALVQAGFVVFKMDNFPRHLVAFVPYAALASGLALTRLADALRARRIRPAWAVIPVMAYLLVFVIDGERPYIQDPRNDAYRWLEAHAPPGTPYFWTRHPEIPGFSNVEFPEAGRPPFLVLEMFDLNPFLSGVGFRDTYPRDYRVVFDAISPDRLDEFQALFQGRSEYREAIRFREGYVMPEYLLANRLVGDRSRNYISEIVIFQKRSGE